MVCMESHNECFMMNAISHGDGIEGSRSAISDLFDASDSLTGKWGSSFES